MIEWPLMKEFEEEFRQQQAQELIERFVRSRFGSALSEDAQAMLRSINDTQRLNHLAEFAGVVTSLGAFVERLKQETTPPPAPVSSRRK